MLPARLGNRQQSAAGLQVWGWQQRGHRVRACRKSQERKEALVLQQGVDGLHPRGDCHADPGSELPSPR